MQVDEFRNDEAACVCACAQKMGETARIKIENIEKKKHTLKRAALYHFIKQYKVVVVCVCGWMVCRRKWNI